MSPKLRTQVTRCCTFERSIATDQMKWRPLLYRSSSRQAGQAIAPAQYSNLKCVSRLRTTLYICPLCSFWFFSMLILLFCFCRLIFPSFLSLVRCLSVTGPPISFCALCHSSPSICVYSFFFFCLFF